LLAVKPHQLEIVLNQLKENGLSSKTIIISILAGVTPQDIENKLKQKNPVITLMTNTAAQKKQAMSALMWGRHLQKTQKVFARKLAKTLGEAIEIKTSDFHSFTAAAGSGIAFVYKLLQSYTLATEKLGLNLKTSELITRQIFKAAITMSENNQYDELIKMVATPGGCTEVGLHTLDKMGLQKIISGTLENTATKAKKLMKK
jgi:pyrroline-5-carboxylate reductase